MSKRFLGFAALLLTLAAAGQTFGDEEDGLTRLQRLAKQAGEAPKSPEAAVENPPMIVLPEGVVRLTDSNDKEVEPAWAPDGDAVYYSFDGTGPAMILRTTLGGAETDTIVSHSHFPATEPAASPDGAYLAYRTSRPDTRRSIWIRRLADGLEGKLNGDQKSREMGVVWSHAGGALYFSRQESDSRFKKAVSCLKNGDGLKTIGREEGDYTAPALSPDGGEIAWIHRVDRESKIVVINTELTALSYDVFTPGYVISSMDWLPDGRRMIVSFLDLSNPRHGFDLGLLDTGSGELQTLLDLGPNDFTPRVSPDGTRVAFSSNLGDAHRIYIWTLPPDLSGEE